MIKLFLRIINAARLAWLYARRDIAKAEVRAMQRMGITGTKAIAEYERQADAYSSEIDRIRGVYGS